jgi:hypothetical protein
LLTGGWNSEEVVAYLAWLGLAQVDRIERRHWVRGRESVQIAYLITILPGDNAAPERLLQLIRDHWAIQNRLHYVRDVTFLEVRCPIRAGARPIAVLRNLAISLIRRAGLAVPCAPSSAGAGGCGGRP